ncbi:MAG TPA: tRNA (adenosine(37)-N6)-dimethylallyltransferase MiaA [Victivallales bacterium]|nr:tRNA (adenosine(37)-N6)-dimethylallyltransferase MiaA [Victivallales bacterium]
MPEPLSIFLMGATATGKSDIAMKVAERFGGEIINADSMQVYKGLDIGTAKPSPEERRQIPHHLIDVLEISEKLDVFKYKNLAEIAVNEIRKNGKIPIFAGGSGMYLKAVIDDLDPLPSDPELYSRLSEEYSDSNGIERLKRFLGDKSPADLSKTYPNLRRMLRAAELVILNERSACLQRTRWDNSSSIGRNLCFIICRDRKELKQRIADRTKQMLEKGWIQEAETMIKKGLLNSPTARQVIGYGIIAEYLSGQTTYEAMRDRIISATIKLARKQDTWFRNKHKDTIRVEMPKDEDLLFKTVEKRIESGI